MRIFEITDKNKFILGISNINADFETEFSMLVELLELLIKLQTPSRNRNALYNIDQFENRVRLFFQNKMLDRSDPDIIVLSEKIKKMETRLTVLKSQLRF